MNFPENRRIKFRVYDFTIERFDPYTYDAGEQFGHPSSGDWVAHQYVWINDVDGKEVYEGDIVEYKVEWVDDNPNSDWTKTTVDKYEVYWDKGLMTFMLRDLNPRGFNRHVPLDGTRIRVIGNIFGK